MNPVYSQEQLGEAIKVFTSSISKCEKARTKLKEGSPQGKYLDRQLETFYISVWLIENQPPKKQPGQCFTELELKSAGKTNEMLIGKLEKLLTKFKDGSPQKTLAVRRLKACQIAAALIARELAEFKAQSLRED